jgi:hypothetical protein
VNDSTINFDVFVICMIKTLQDINFRLPEVQKSVVTGKGEGAVVPLLAMKARMTSEDTAPFIFNLRTRWM